MAEITQFIPPPFLDGNSAEEIHRRMLRRLPEDMDKGEGGFPWDYTRPTADEKAEYVGYTLMNAIRGIFPAWCDPFLLPYHAQMRGMKRKAAERARVSLLLSGTEGTELPAGFRVSTAAVYDKPGVTFTLDAMVTLRAAETAAMATAVEPGAAGNVAADAITIVDAPIKGLATIRNPAAAFGGIDEEDDEALRARIVEFDMVQGVSYVGSDADYRHQAMEVPGVGSASVQGGENGDNTVKLTITDSQGNPAGEALRQAVYDHIMRPDDRELRLAGVNDLLIVRAPAKLTIAVAASVQLDGTALLSEVKEELRARLDAYYRDEKTVKAKEIRYTAIAAALHACTGVADYKDLTVNGGTANLAVAAASIPITEAADITMTEVADV